MDHIDQESQCQLAIEDTVEVPLKFTVKSRRVNKVFAFTLYCDRISQEEINEDLADGSTKVTDVMRKVIKGWDEHQRLVLGADGKPAEFSETARDKLLSVAGVGVHAYNKYMLEIGAKEKN